MVGRDGPIDELVALYDGDLARRLYDEVVTERQHALQCAALAVHAGAGPELVAAALLHDVGHLVLDDNCPLTESLPADFEHEKAGARYLARWFPPSVTAPIALHVEAKRYLCATEAGYLESLSPSSVRSLAVQGGPMNESEVADFSARPGSENAIAVRRWDDLGKVDDLDVAEFDAYIDVLARLVVDRPG
jgi:gamma-butyrobetaine dioxygenase